MSVRYLVGDVPDRLADIADGSVSLVASSPPFIALRSYLPADHPDKDKEIGSEPNPAAFLDTLLNLTAEWGRVLAPWGSIAIELGDTYSGAGGYGNPDSPNPAYSAQSFVDRFEGRTAKRFKRADDGWPRAKCLALIPQAYALSLAYGINVLTGQPSPAGQWLVRNVIVWHRPNPAVGALGDKVRPSTSYITVATRSPKRWFDLTAIRTEPKDFGPRYSPKLYEPPGQSARTVNPIGPDGIRIQANTAGAPPLDCWFDEHDTWTITTQPSNLSHFAMWPAKLAERLILSMCPAEVCTVCDTPRRRVERTTNAIGEAAGRRSWRADPVGIGAGHSGDITRSISSAPTAERETLGWSDCGHNAYTPGTVLDPFCGTGTSLCVADLLGRDAVGIDIDERNEQLYEARWQECRRALFGTPVADPNQIELFAVGDGL